MDPLPEWPFKLMTVLMVAGAIASLTATGALIWGVIKLVSWVVTK
jgi:hypothetical protein